MKTITILLLFTLSFMACHNATPKATKQEVFKKDTIPKKAISVDWYIKKFHDTIIHSPHDTLHLFIRVFASVTSGEHTIDERIYDSITFDNELNSGGQSRTRLDTVIKIPGTNPTGYCVLFSENAMYDNGEEFNCVGCGRTYTMAYLIEEKDSVKKITTYKIQDTVYDFTELGQFGNGGDIALADFGKEYVLQITGLSSGQGDYEYTEHFYNIYSGDELFSYVSSDNDSDNDGTTSALYHATETKRIMIPAKNGNLDDIKLDCKKTRYDTLHHQLVYTFNTEYYRMNEDSACYIKVKK